MHINVDQVNGVEDVDEVGFNFSIVDEERVMWGEQESLPQLLRSSRRS